MSTELFAAQAKYQATPQGISYALLNSATAVGAGTEFTVSAADAGVFKFSATGTFGGATVTLQIKPAGQGAFIPVLDLQAIITAQLTTAGEWVVRLAIGDIVRANVTSATGTTSVSSRLVRS